MKLIKTEFTDVEETKDVVYSENRDNNGGIKYWILTDFANK